MDERTLTLIVPGDEATESTEMTEVEIKDRGGGTLHSRRFFSKFLPKEKNVDLAVARDKLDGALKQTGELLAVAEKKSFGKWELEEVTVGLTVTAEGSIGVATAGMEASIELKFSRSPD